MLFIRGNIPSEALFIELNLRKKKLCCGYNPSKSNPNQFTYDIDKVLYSFIGNYDNFLIVGDLNSEICYSWTTDSISFNLYNSSLILIFTNTRKSIPTNCLTKSENRQYFQTIFLHEY